MKKDVSRRVFLERLNASGLGAATLSLLFNRRVMGQNMDFTAPDIGLDAQPNTTAWTPPGVLKNPNILLIIVDQMRYPVWLNSSQTGTLQQSYLPNIFGRLRDNSYVFQNYFTAGTACMSARATLLAGFYSPQTCVYTTSNNGPGLNTTYPTWGKAVQFLNPAYQNSWWFGKWHLSDAGSGSSSGGPQPLQSPGGAFSQWNSDRLRMAGKSYLLSDPLVASRLRRTAVDAPARRRAGRRGSRHGCRAAGVRNAAVELRFLSAEPDASYMVILRCARRNLRQAAQHGGYRQQEAAGRA